MILPKDELLGTSASHVLVCDGTSFYPVCCSRPMALLQHSAAFLNRKVPSDQDSLTHINIYIKYVAL